MKWNYTLTWIAVIYILTNIFFAWDMSNCTGGTSIVYVIAFPIFWFVSAVVVGVWCYRKRTIWFQKKMKFSTLLLLFFCTPFLALLYSKMNEPDIVRSSARYFNKNGKNYKCESYVYYNTNKEARLEIWVKNPLSNTAYDKDSNWVYLDRTGDTLKTIRYDNNLVVEEINYKNKANNK